MGKWIYFFSPLFVLLAAVAPLSSDSVQQKFNFASPIGSHREILFHNRILAEINKKTISLLDVVKQMDLFIHDYYPDRADSEEFRYQFYSSQWKATLQHMIENELIIADAESQDFKLNEGMVNQEMHNRFGPDIIKTVEQLDLSYEEAKQILHEELIVQHMQFFKIYSKVNQKITPQEIKNEYLQHIEKNPPKSRWNYQFITIQSEQLSKAEEIGKRLLFLLKEKGEPSVAIQLCGEELSGDVSSKINLSQDYDLEEKGLSKEHREILVSIGIGEWSDPVVQIRKDGTYVVRLFFLKTFFKDELPSFESMLSSLRQQLFNRYSSQERAIYIKKLEKKFLYDQKRLETPSGFEPFSLR